MEIKERINQTLAFIADELKEVAPYSCIIGASAMILHGYGIGDTADIDILTTSEGSDKLQLSLKEYMETTPLTKENELFRSNFARFQLPLMDVEVMGELQVCKDKEWRPVFIEEYTTLHIENVAIRIPTLKEQIRVLSLFGREKDYRRINQLRNLRGKY
ncbi:hypothetical protein [Bacteroides stercorirosoris]|jgi:hypothetical protein|uniref:hypothetical protein n=1 Tax=Bacteroides stercorirosoris TaxID=871324 RepID=UPI003520FA3C